MITHDYKLCAESDDCLKAMSDTTFIGLGGHVYCSGGEIYRHLHFLKGFEAVHWVEAHYLGLCLCKCHKVTEE